MSLTYTKPNDTALPIAKLRKKTDKVYNGIPVYIDETKSGVEKLHTPDDRIFEPMPVIQPHNRLSMYVSAPSNGGKSYYMANMVRKLQKLKGHKPAYSKRPVYVFSANSDPDPAYDGIKHLGYINMDNPKLFELTIEMFENCIVVLDDWDSHTNPDVNDWMQRFIVRLLERTRKLGVDVLVAVHQTRAGFKTKPMIFECQDYVLYPKAGINAIKKFLREYMDFSKEQLDDIKTFETRALHVSKTAPQYMIAEDRIQLL